MGIFNIFGNIRWVFYGGIIVLGLGFLYFWHYGPLEKCQKTNIELFKKIKEYKKKLSYKNSEIEKLHTEYNILQTKYNIFCINPDEENLSSNIKDTENEGYFIF